MLITDLNYLESVDEATILEGGTDWAATLTAFSQALSMLQTGATSGPNGSSAFANIGRLNMATLGLGAVFLGV